MKLKIFILSIVILPINLSAQQNPIVGICPFLEINYHPEIDGLGGIGTVSLRNNNETGLYKNPALLNTNSKLSGLTLTRSSHISLAEIYNAGIYYSLNSKITLGYVFNYFNTGEFYWQFNGFSNTNKIYDYYHSLRFSYSVTDNLSYGFGLKYIHSQGYLQQKINSYAIDLGVRYTKNIYSRENFYIRNDFGADIQNIGPKVSYSDDVPSDFIPISLNLATGLAPYFILSERLSVGLSGMYEVSKYLMPTPPIYKEDENGYLVIDEKGDFIIESGKNPNVGVFKGMVQSFYDAPGGTKEELQEIMHRIGFEPWLKYRSFELLLRYGRYFEHENKGNRKIRSYGFGLIVSNFKIDYFSSKMINRNYNNTWGISLGYKKMI